MVNIVLQPAPVRQSAGFRSLGVRRFIACLLIGLLPSIGYSAREPLPSYPNGKVEISIKEARQNHPVITSRMKRVNGVVTSDNARWQSGMLHRTLYQLPSGHGSEQGYDFFVTRLKELGVKPLFECQSFSCGASNFWANDIFKIPRLYGQDKAQSYFVGEQAGAVYFVYSVKRGNGRVYTLVDIFEPEGGIQASSDSGFAMILSNKVALEKRLSQFTSQLKNDEGSQALFIIRGELPDGISKYDQRISGMNEWAAELENTLNQQDLSKERYRIHTSLCKGCGGASIKGNNQDLVLEGILWN
ncbi:DUF4892 domain-containing protein [Endozoicomonas ascidiicola]|nr:DUF4892 domain-containing protein [Endozoicomonas ascidiicola]